MDGESIKEKIGADAQWDRYYEFLGEEGGKRDFNRTVEEFLFTMGNYIDDLGIFNLLLT